MSANFDREGLALLRAMLRIAVMSMTSGLHHLPPEVASSKAAHDAMQALRVAFEGLRDNDAAPATRDRPDELAAVLDIVSDLRDALAPVAREGVGPVELYSRAAVARAAAKERRGAPMADADNLVRLPVNAGHALKTKAARIAPDEEKRLTRPYDDDGDTDFLPTDVAEGNVWGIVAEFIARGMASFPDEIRARPGIQQLESLSEEIQETIRALDDRIEPALPGLRALWVDAFTLAHRDGFADSDLFSGWDGDE